MSGAAPSGVERIHVGIGSNLEGPREQVRRAVAALAAHPALRLAGCSRLYANPPVGPVAQPDFVNAVAALDTVLGPRETLDALLGIESSLGRVRGTLRWGPRVIDLDLLLHGERIVDEPGLQVPHPRIAERAFVLVPLVELAPSLVVPGLGPARALLACVDERALEPLGDVAPAGMPADTMVAAGRAER